MQVVSKYKAIPVPDSFTNFEALYRRIVEACPKKGGKIVEIGAWLGKSAVLMAELIEQSGKKIHFVTVDPFVVQPVFDGQLWQFGEVSNSYKPDAHALFEKHIREAGYQQEVFLLADYSEGAVRQFEDNTLDAVFIDGAHDAENVAFDLRAWYPKVKSGGIIAGHDYSPDLGWARDLCAEVHKFVKTLDVPADFEYHVSPKQESFYFIKP